tara:strand:- start:8820 stop:9977 length:1158 start_codon:yes stop_codon:yes gene_type:complete
MMTFDQRIQQGMDIGRNVGTNIGGAFQDARDTSSLDQLIEEAKASNDTSKLEQILGRIQDPQKRDQGVRLIKEKMAKTETQNQSIKDYQKLIDLGFNPEEAKQYSQILANIPVGAQTETWKQIFDIKKRMPKQPSSQSKNPLTQDADPEKPGYQEPDIDNFIGMTPSERIKSQSEFRKINLPIWEQAKNGYKSAQAEIRAVDQLARIDATGKLPKGLERLNINPSSGELIFPAASNAETQLYVKTINDFTTKAKDSYGGRVTNFELARFMQRLPSPANTKEGRELIAKAMTSIAKINALQQKTLVDVYRKHGAQNIDPIQAEEIAEQKMKPELDKLITEYEAIIPEQAQEVGLPPGNIKAEINGQQFSIPEGKREEFLKMGGKIL